VRDWCSQMSHCITRQQSSICSAFYQLKLYCHWMQSLNWFLLITTPKWTWSDDMQPAIARVPSHIDNWKIFCDIFLAFCVNCDLLSALVREFHASACLSYVGYCLHCSMTWLRIGWLWPSWHQTCGGRSTSTQSVSSSALSTAIHRYSRHTSTPSTGWSWPTLCHTAPSARWSTSFVDDWAIRRRQSRMWRWNRSSVRSTTALCPAVTSRVYYELWLASMFRCSFTTQPGQTGLELCF